MRILLVHNFYQLYAGEDNAFEETVRALRESGHEVDTVTARNDDIPAGRIARLAAGPLVAVSTFFNPVAFARVVASVRRHRPEIAIVQNVFPLLSPSVYLALRLLGVPVLQRSLNYRPVCANGILFTEGSICERCVGGTFLHAVRHRCYRESRSQTAVFATSLRMWKRLGLWRWGVQTYLPSTDFLFEKLRPHLGAQPHTTVRVRAPQPPPEPIDDAPRGRSVLFVGRLVREKGIFTVLDAAARLRDLGDDSEFRIVGVGDHMAQAQEHASSLGLTEVRWLGALYGEEVWQELRSAGVFVVPSEWYDNLPTVVSQAMFSRAPIVASRINGIPEIVRHDDNGLLFTPGSAEELAAAIRRVLDDPAEARTRADRAYRTAQLEFGEQVFRERLAAVVAGRSWTR